MSLDTKPSDSEKILNMVNPTIMVICDHLCVSYLLKCLSKQAKQLSD